MLWRGCRQGGNVEDRPGISLGRGVAGGGIGTIVIVVIGSIILRSSRFGRQLYAVGSNPEAAAIPGIPSRRVLFTAFALCGPLPRVSGTSSST